MWWDCKFLEDKTHVYPSLTLPWGLMWHLAPKYELNEWYSDAFPRLHWRTHNQISYIYIYMVWFSSSRVLPLNFSCWNASVIRLPVTQYMPRDSPFNSFHLPRPTLVIREMSLRNLIGFTIFVWCRMLEKVAGQDASSCKHNPNKSPKGSLFSFCMLVLSYVELTL